MRRLLMLLVLMLAAMAMAADSPEAVLMKADRDFNAATQARHVDGWMEFMADNVVLGRDQAVVGRDAVRETMKDTWDDPSFSLTWEPTKGEMFPDGSMGYTTGRWTRSRKDKDGKMIVGHGNYLTVWAKQKDGSFKVLWDGGAADPTPVAAK